MSVSQDPVLSSGVRKLRRQKEPKVPKAHSPEARMPLLEHIRELRSRVLKAITTMVLGAIAGWFIEPYIWTVIIRPFCSLPPKDNGGITVKNHACHLYVTGLFDPLFIHLKLGLGGVIAFFAMSKGLRFLLSLIPKDVTAIITVDTYFSYVLAMLLIFGLA